MSAAEQEAFYLSGMKDSKVNLRLLHSVATPFPSQLAMTLGVRRRASTTITTTTSQQ